LKTKPGAKSIDGENPMGHSDAKFEKIGKTERALYGPKKLLVCGFPADGRKLFAAAQKTAGVGAVETVWLDESHADHRLADLMEMPGGTDNEAASAAGLPRAVIVGGIAETQLRSLMTVAKKTGITNVLWAVLTPTSEQWTLARLLAELESERRAVQK
jgi:hypothetical protein